MDLTFGNPVWEGYLADPFVLKWQEEYYAYGTGSSVGDRLEADGKMFPLLHSVDLVNWKYLGGALEPLANSEGFPYWAPSVAYKEDKFYLYYSVEGVAGHGHQLRVALSDYPSGPFRDSGKVLLPDVPFSIDAHPFCDPHSGEWYLFFADEMMEGNSIGTGVMVCSLAKDMVTVLDKPTTVLRGQSAWQIHWNQVVKNGRQFENWYTLEGPCVIERNGLYYCFYSGGAWENESYGVSFAVALHAQGPYEDIWSAKEPQILRSVVGKVKGPGHNSIVEGLDNQTLFIVYHAWNEYNTRRQMWIDELIWTKHGPRSKNPFYLS